MRRHAERRAPLRPLRQRLCSGSSVYDGRVRAVLRDGTDRVWSLVCEHAEQHVALRGVRQCMRDGAVVRLWTVSARVPDRANGVRRSLRQPANEQRALWRVWQRLRSRAVVCDWTVSARVPDGANGVRGSVREHADQRDALRGVRQLVSDGAIVRDWPLPTRVSNRTDGVRRRVREHANEQRALRPLWQRVCDWLRVHDGRVRVARDARRRQRRSRDRSHVWNATLRRRAAASLEHAARSCGPRAQPAHGDRQLLLPRHDRRGAVSRRNTVFARRGRGLSLLARRRKHRCWRDVLDRRRGRSRVARQSGALREHHEQRAHRDRRGARRPQHEPLSHLLDSSVRNAGNCFDLSLNSQSTLSCAVPTPADRARHPSEAAPEARSALRTEVSCRRRL